MAKKKKSDDTAADDQLEDGTTAEIEGEGGEETTTTPEDETEGEEPESNPGTAEQIIETADGQHLVVADVDGDGLLEVVQRDVLVRGYEYDPTEERRIEQLDKWLGENPTATRVPPSLLPGDYQDAGFATPGLPPELTVVRRES